jgi:hypothetical protein
MLIMVFLIGALLGLLAGALVCMRYIRQEMTANLAPRLNAIQRHLDTLGAEVNLALATSLADRSRRHVEDSGPPRR